MPGSRKILRNFHCKVLLNFLRVLDVFLELLSDSKNHVDFLVDEISEPGHTVKSLCCRQLRRIYTTFILGTALLNLGPRADNFGYGPLDFLRVNANFSARVPKNLGGPRPPLEVVPARFLGVPCPNFSNFARPYG